MREILREGIDRRYVLLPLVSVTALVIASFFVAEARRDYTRGLSETVSERQDRLRVIAELTYTSMDVESAQRGYLLTGDRKYIEPYEEGRKAALDHADDLIRRYDASDSQEVPVLKGVRTRLEIKFTETDQTIRMMAEGKSRDAVAQVKTDVGLYYMREVRDELEGLRGREVERVNQTLRDWNNGLRVNTYINLASTIFTVILLMLVGLLSTREIRRRAAAADKLRGLVEHATVELRELSAHMLRIGEFEKAALGRELHDELGGLLVTMRMDLANLRRRVTLPDADAETRWRRIDSALAAGVELKRRVIEDLRPTLLDNLGLVAALRWQAEQRCSQGHLRLELDLPEEEPVLSGDVSIAIFRCVQEILSNVLKHAHATQVKISLRYREHLFVVVEDDGVGLPEGAAQRSGSHGLKQMVFRMQAVGGVFYTEPAVPHGTRTGLTVPAAALGRPSSVDLGQNPN
ncbi:MAG: CHASE3 domain-containing protein [Gammaproteobacteria bacterium]